MPVGWSSEVFDGVLFEQCCHVHRDSTGIGNLKLSSCSSIILVIASATGSGTGSLAGLYNISTSA